MFLRTFLVFLPLLLWARGGPLPERGGTSPLSPTSPKGAPIEFQARRHIDQLIQLSGRERTNTLPLSTTARKSLPQINLGNNLFPAGISHHDRLVPLRC